MFLYRFVRRRRPQPQILVHVITFEQLLGYLSFLAQLLALTYIRFWSIFVVTLTLNFQGQIWNLLYLSQKWSYCPIATKRKANTSTVTLGLKCLTLAMTLTLNFQGQLWNLLYFSQKWCDCHETKSKHID